MSLQIIHTSEARSDVVPSQHTAGSYSQSQLQRGSSANGADHPVALSVVTLGDVDRRRSMSDLVGDNLSLVDILVAERLRTLPSHVSRDDLRSAGMMALVLSASAYEPDRGVSFRSFAALRIRGALIDELRGMDWASRSVRSRARELDAAIRSLENILDRSPTPAEIAAKVGISLGELHAVRADLARGTLMSLQGAAAEKLSDVLADHAPGPESMLLYRERLGYLHDAIDALPDRLRTVVEAVYFQNRLLSEVAAELSVTQSRVSQMCAEAVSLLRDGINSQLDPEALPPLARTGRAAATRSAYYDAVACRNTVAGRLAMSSPHGDIRRHALHENHERASRIA